MIDIIVPVFNVLEKTILFVESLKNQVGHRLIIIDNGSNKETKKYINYLDACVITNQTNKGYVKAINQGINYIKNEYILFANNDIIMPEGSLKQLKKIFKKHDIVGPLINQIKSPKNSNNKLLVDFDSFQTFIEEFNYYIYNKNYNQVESVDMVYGHCMLMKRELLERIGKLDEIYGLGNYEDMDFCRRAIESGMKVG